MVPLSFSPAPREKDEAQYLNIELVEGGARCRNSKKAANERHLQGVWTVGGAVAPPCRFFFTNKMPLIRGGCSAPPCLTRGGLGAPMVTF